MNKLRFPIATYCFAVAGSMVLLIALAPGAFAQQRAGSNGHALDANGRVGSGRVNDQQNKIDYNARNNVITGNVPGLQAFQGRVNYNAPGEFAGQTAGDQIFRFNRQSLPSAPTRLNGIGAVSTYGNYNAAGTVYRNFSYPGQSYRVQAQQLTGQQGTVYEPGNLSQGFSLSSRQQNVPSDTLGFVPIPNGNVLQVNASPLLGVRESTLKAQPKAETSLTPSTPLYQSQSEELNRPFALTGKTRQTDLQKLLGETPNSAAVNTPTAVLGMQLQEQVNLQSASNRETLEENFSKLQTMVHQQLMNRKAAEGDQVYQRVLQKIQKPGNTPKASPQPTRQPGPGQQGQVPGAGAGVTGQPKNTQGGSGTTTGNGIGTFGSENSTAQGGLIAPTPEQLKQAEIDRQNAVRKAYGLPPLAPANGGEKGKQSGNHKQNQNGNQSNNAPGSQQGNSNSSNNQSLTQQKGSQKPNAVVKALRYQMAPLNSLIASRKGRVNKMMAKAEKQMAAGKYFDAESSYRQVLIDEPKRPLARAGLVNAELGAGLIRTAAVNLHRLYNEHPELINLRYGKNLLPSEHRLKWIQKQLMKMISEGESAAYPGLMMAYLGHQVGSHSLIKYGLAVGQTNHPKDPLLTVLRRVWLTSTRTTTRANSQQHGKAASPHQPSGK